MNKELSKGFTGIEINGVRFSNVKEMLIYMNKQRDHIITLEKENAELKCECRRCVYSDTPCILSDYGKDGNGICDHFKDVFDENIELKDELKKWKDKWQEQVQKATDEGYARTLQTVQLTKAKELLKGWLGDFYSPKAFYQQRAELVEQSEQFLKENSTYERIQKAKYNYTD